MRLLSAAALGALLSAPAFAGGLTPVVEEPVVAVPAPVVVPTADWSGFYAGVQLGYGDVDADAFGDGNGAIGGVHAGYRWDLGSTVLGLGADYNVTNIDHADSGAELDAVARLKLSAGYDLGNTLVYVTAGPAYAKASAGGTDYSDNGYFAGIGMDYALTQNWTVGGELLTHRFKDFDSTGIDYDATTLQAKVSYRF